MTIFELFKPLFLIILGFLLVCSVCLLLVLVLFGFPNDNNKE